MIFENEIGYVKNKEYIYVLTDNYNNYDLSIFEIEEWTHLTKISRVFEDAVDNLNSLEDGSYMRTSEEIKKSGYYLYYSPFCNQKKGFNNLEYEMLEINDIYKVVFDLVKENKKLTINDFRKWIIENYTDIESHYENLVKNY